jgi:hypothetical protein
MQKAKGNLLEICAQARKIFGVTDIGNDNHQGLKVNPEVKTRIGLESESDSESNSESESDSESNNSESERESNADHGVHEDRGEDNCEADRNSDIHYHNNDADDGNGHDDSGLSRSEDGLGVVDSLECRYNHHGLDAEKNYRGEESEEVVDPGPSRRRGRRDTKSWI